MKKEYRQSTVNGEKQPKKNEWKDILAMILSAYRILIPVLLFLFLAAAAVGWGFLCLLH